MRLEEKLCFTKRGFEEIQPNGRYGFAARHLGNVGERREKGSTGGNRDL